MPFTNAEIQRAGKTSLDFYIKKKTTDQIATERPLLKLLMAKKKDFPGGKQYIMENIRTNYGSNFQHYHGKDTVSYNERDTQEQVSYGWCSFHDGFMIDEDTLLQNGIVIDDKCKPGTASGAEQVQLINLFDEQMEALMLGLEQNLDLSLHRDGSANPNAVGGLDMLVSTNPAVGTVGGINRATQDYWRNAATMGLTSANLLETMEKNWRACSRNGGKPDAILAGADFIDAYADTVRSAGQVLVQNGDTFTVEGGNDNYSFKKTPIVYDPVFEDLDTMDAPAHSWAKRCYFLNTRHITLRPASGHWMVDRTPKRDSDKYVHKFAITGKYGMTMNRSNAHAVMSVS